MPEHDDYGSLTETPDDYPEHGKLIRRKLHELTEELTALGFDLGHMVLVYDGTAALADGTREGGLGMEVNNDHAKCQIGLLAHAQQYILGELVKSGEVAVTTINLDGETRDGRSEDDPRDISDDEFLRRLQNAKLN